MVPAGVWIGRWGRHDHEWKWSGGRTTPHCHDLIWSLSPSNPAHFPPPIPWTPAGVSAVVTGEPMLLALYYWVLTLTLNSHLTYRSIFSRGWVVSGEASDDGHASNVKKQ